MHSVQTEMEHSSGQVTFEATGLNKCKRVEIILSIFSNYSDMKL